MTKQFFCSAATSIQPTTACVASAPHRLRRFAADRKGTTAAIFALTVVPLIGMIAAAMDYSDYLKTTSQIQSQVDAAVLAASSASNSGLTRDQAATKFFDATPKPNGVTVLSRSFTYDADTGKVSGSATVTKPMLLSTVAGLKFQAKVEAGAVPKGTAIRALDLAFCVDSTGSMSNTLSMVQNNTANFKTNLNNALKAKGMPPFDQLRVRLIYFRDYGGNGYRFAKGDYGDNYRTPAAAHAKYGNSGIGDATPIQASNFFNLDIASEATAYQNYVYNKSASGGGDLPEAGLECVWTAMQSQWSKVDDTLADGRKVQQVHPVIAIYTDAGAHPPDFPWSTIRTDYPAAMPRNYGGLRSMWNDSAIIDQTNKKILFYGNPDKDDDYYFDLNSGRKDVKQWPNFANPGSLTSANMSFINTLAAGIAGAKTPYLTD